MILRPVGLEACFTLADLHDRAFDRPWSAEEFETLLRGPGAFAVLGEAGEPEHAKGFILCRAVAGEAEILTVAVDPAARRRGWGSALVEMAAGIAGRAAPSRCSWRSRPTMSRRSSSTMPPVSAAWA